jgi:hypothetical protein
LVEKNDERFYEAEVWRIYGELALQRNETEKRRRGETEKKAESSSLADSPIRRFPDSVAEFPVSSPEEAFLKAIAIAQKQQAKSLELRATMSLVRLRQQQAAQSASRIMHHETRAKLDEAHRMLSEVYNWFTEGFDTADLKDAKALLEELT